MVWCTSHKKFFKKINFDEVEEKFKVSKEEEKKIIKKNSNQYK